MLQLLSGALGQGFFVAALLVALVLEVVDQLADTRPDAGGAVVRRLRGPAGRALRTALVVLVVAALAATFIRIFVVVR